MTTVDDLPALVHPLVPEAPALGDLRVRAAARRRRRRRTSTGALAAALLVVLGGVAATRVNPADGVRTAPDDGAAEQPGGPGAAGPPVGPPTAPSAGAGMALAPGGPLRPGDSVRLVLDPAVPDGTSALVAQCPAERLADLATATADSRGCRVHQWQAVADRGLEVVVEQVVRGTERVDCAAAPRRCVLVVRLGEPATSTDERWSPITFVPGVAAPGEPRVAAVRPDAPDGTYADGEQVTVSVAGYDAGDTISLLLCRGDADPRPAPRYTAAVDACDHTEVPEATVRSDGTASLSLRVRRELVTPDGQPSTCGACVIRVGSQATPGPRLVPVTVG